MNDLSNILILMGIAVFFLSLIYVPLFFSMRKFAKDFDEANRILEDLDRRSNK